MKTYGEKYNITILNLGTGWRKLVSFTLQPLYLRRNSTRHPMYRSQVGPTAGLDVLQKKIILVLLPGIEHRLFDCTTRSVVVYVSTKLSLTEAITKIIFLFKWLLS
jgi:hypothetical protein